MILKVSLLKINYVTDIEMKLPPVSEHLYIFYESRLSSIIYVVLVTQ